jgi:hypothetical protein
MSSAVEFAWLHREEHSAINIQRGSTRSAATQFFAPHKLRKGRQRLFLVLPPHFAQEIRKKV